MKWARIKESESVLCCGVIHMDCEINRFSTEPLCQITDLPLLALFIDKDSFVKSPASTYFNTLIKLCLQERQLDSQSSFDTWSVDLMLCAVRGPRAIRSWQVVSCDHPLWTGHIYGKIMEWFWWLEKVPVNNSELYARCTSAPSLSSVMNA